MPLPGINQLALELGVYNTGGGTGDVTQAEFDAFIDQAVYAVGYQIYYGRQLKLYIKSVQTHEVLDAFVDSRT